MKGPQTAILLLFCCFSIFCYAQDQPDKTAGIIDLPSRFFHRMQSKTAGLDEQLTRQTEKYLRRMARKEAILKRRLFRLDSTKAADLFAENVEQQYLALAEKLVSDSSRTVHSMGPEYLPYADSLQSSLAFITKHTQSFSQRIDGTQAVAALSQVQQLQAKLQDADYIKQCVQQRREQIKQYLGQYTHLPAGIAGTYNDYNKELFYYQARVRSYRQMLNDPDKMFMTALGQLHKLPAFETFMKRNSYLAGLFNISSNYGSPEGLDGLQTRDQVLTMIQNKIGAGGSGAASAMQSSLQTAQQDIQKMQDKISKLGGGSSDMDMPNFKPQMSRIKTFFQRLEYGVNLQTQHAAYYYPTVTDLGLSIGYKLSEKATIGIQGSYKAGWGSSVNHIKFSRQGASVRSFIDINAKKSFYVSGGYEYNFTPSPFLEKGMLVTPSGLIGVSKIISMRSSLFKKTKAQFLWDFLSYSRMPRTPAVLFRFGYGF